MRWLGLCFIFLVSASIRAEFNSFEEFFNSNIKSTPLTPSDSERLEEYYLEFVKSTDKDQQASLVTKISLFKSEKLEIYYAKKLEKHFQDQPLTEEALRSLGLLARVTASTDFALDFLLRIYLETKADVSKSISKFKAEEVGMALSRYPHQSISARYLSLFLTYQKNIPKPLVWERLANGNSHSLRLYNEFSNSVNIASEDKKLDFLNVFIEKYQTQSLDQMIICKNETHINLYGSSREILFNLKPELLRQFLFLHEQDGKSELLKVRKNISPPALAKFSSKYFYSIPGLKALLEFSFGLAKSKQFLLALALVEEGLETIEKFSAINEKYLEIQQPFTLLAIYLSEALGDINQKQEFEKKIKDYKVVISKAPVASEHVTLDQQVEHLINSLYEKTLNNLMSISVTLQTKKISTILMRNKYSINFNKTISLIRSDKYPFKSDGACNAFTSDLTLIFDSLAQTSRLGIFTDYAATGDAKSALKKADSFWMESPKINLLLVRKGSLAIDIQKKIISSGPAGKKAFLDELATLSPSDMENKNKFIQISRHFGTQIKDEMMTLLSSSDDTSRYVATMYFCYFPSVEEAFPFLIKNLGHKNQEIVNAAYSALYRRPLKSEHIIEIWKIAETSVRPDTLYNVLDILSSKLPLIRTMPLEFRKKFLTFFQAHHKKLDQSLGPLFYILYEINIDLEPALELIKQYADQQNMTYLAVKCFLRMGPKGKQIFQNYLNSNDQKVKVMAIYSLQDINENLDFFFEDLTKLSLNPKESYEIRVSAIQALCRVPKFNIQLQEPALKTLTQLLEDKNIKLQSATLGALVNLKELAMPLMPKIVTFFENESPAYENAISAFSSLGKARLNVLLDCLSSPKAKVKTAALRSIRYTVEGLDPQKLFNAIKLNWKGGDTTLEFEALISLQAIMSGYPDKTRAEEFKKICEEGLKSSNSKIVDYCKRLLKSV